MERKLGGKWFGGGSAAFLYLSGRSNGAAITNSRINPTAQLHELFMGCLQLGGLDSLENVRRRP